MSGALRAVARLFAVVSLIQTTTTTSAVIDDASFGGNVIHKDVVIVGGGASGSYAAVRLREDFGLNIALIEQKDRLGGHVDTYFEPETGRAFDFGVQSYFQYLGAKEFFTRMGVNTTAPAGSPVNTTYVDFISGKAVPTYTPPALADITAAVKTYLEVCKKYEDMILPGYQNFPVPGQIPEDLLMPFGELLTKYGVEVAAPLMFYSTGVGTGYFLKAMTLTMMQTFGVHMSGSILGQVEAFGPASRNNMELYEKITALLGNDIMFESTVVDSRRTAQGVQVVVNGKDGRKLIHAKRLLVTIPPLLKNLQPFDLDKEERDVFSKFNHTITHVGIVSHSSLPLGTTLQNTPPSAAPANYLIYPEIPFVSGFSYMGRSSEYWRVIAVGDPDFNVPNAQNAVQTAFGNFAKAGIIPDPGDEKLRFVDWESHGPTHVHVTADDLRNGFMQKMNSMQGRRSTWYTGAAWTAQFTTIVWAFTDTILPELVRGL